MFHVAPLPGLMKELKKVSMVYVTGDLVRPYTHVRLDLTSTPIKSCTFDLVYCSNVLEHIVDDVSAIAELYRVTKIGGLAIIQVPRRDGDTTLEDPSVTSPEERERLYGQYDHVRYYGRDVIGRLEAPGFEVQQCIMPDDLQMDPEEVTRYGMEKRELVFLCSKVDARPR